jgi:hypothetical protein
MSEPPKLEKAVWEQSDFERMGWHDCTVHALAFEPNSDGSGTLLVDLDYIVQWVQPVSPGYAFSFWVAPATLIFEDAWGFEAEVSEYSGFRLELDGMQRSEPDEFGRNWWTLDGRHFTVRLLSAGFTQVLRHGPIASKQLSLVSEVRGVSAFQWPPLCDIDMAPFAGYAHSSAPEDQFCDADVRLRRRENGQPLDEGRYLTDVRKTETSESWR